MKKKYEFCIVSLLAVALTVCTISASEYRLSKIQTAYAKKTELIQQSTVSETVATVPQPETSNASRGGAPEENAPVETLDWWTDARYIFAKDSTATVKDIFTGKTFNVVRTMGSNHADTEALTAADTEIIKSIWGGFSWTRRPIYVYINGRVLAASMSAMPHAGIDSEPAYTYIKNRSSGYGSGQNLDVIKNNNMDGHFDIHFLNSTRHKDGQKDPQHQEMIRIASQK